LLLCSLSSLLLLLLLQLLLLLLRSPALSLLLLLLNLLSRFGLSFKSLLFLLSFLLKTEGFSLRVRDVVNTNLLSNSRVLNSLSCLSFLPLYLPLRFLLC
jgi:hypothetical protein